MGNHLPLLPGNRRLGPGRGGAARGCRRVSGARGLARGSPGAGLGAGAGRGRAGRGGRAAAVTSWAPSLRGDSPRAPSAHVSAGPGRTVTAPGDLADGPSPRLNGADSLRAGRGRPPGASVPPSRPPAPAVSGGRWRRRRSASPSWECNCGQGHLGARSVLRGAGGCGGRLETSGSACPGRGCASSGPQVGRERDRDREGEVVGCLHLLPLGWGRGGGGFCAGNNCGSGSCLRKAVRGG